MYRSSICNPICETDIFTQKMSREVSNTPGQPADVSIPNTKTAMRQELADTPYGRSSRVVHRLRDLGIDRMELGRLDGKAFAISLPKIVLVGNQSSGKSSLIEAISEISVPRDTDTCTKCPMEVRICEEGGPWCCKVSLRRQHERPVHFKTIHNKKEVENVLRMAQRAILNPSVDLEVFYEEPCNVTSEAPEFSEDTVLVEITGASMNITFIDLPGLISVEKKVNGSMCNANIRESKPTKGLKTRSQNWLRLT
jgi:hypothetical protein